ncbi:unnamed protein product [Parnassius apollo]|uniref:(apollo) hypothetical protein n=1 Tax=Parnassius apollo TaxID=110799 RepID=A0A8S3XFT1_PARAO|nr:unnamed protein product [Parnassius apollo]
MTAPVSSPVDDLNLPEDAIIESQLEKVFGDSAIVNETIDDQESYSVSSLINILDTEQLSDDPPIQVTNEYMSQEKSGEPPIQITNEYMETQKKSGTQEEWRQEAYVSERDIEIQECLDEICGESINR